MSDKPSRRIGSFAVDSGFVLIRPALVGHLVRVLRQVPDGAVETLAKQGYGESTLNLFRELIEELEAVASGKPDEGRPVFGDADWLTVKEAAGRTGYCEKSIRQFCQSGLLGAVKWRRGWRIPASALDSFMASWARRRAA